MQESCPYGSVRGAPSNGCPYRNRPASAKKAMTHLGEHRFDLGELAGFAPPDAAALSWLGFCRMLRRLCDAATAWAGQVGPAYSHLPGIRLS
jgi:hypothetical protein